MDWRTTPANKREGALKSNPFAGFAAYETAPAQTPAKSDAVKEGEEAATAPRNFGGSVASDSYDTASESR
ncbi:MAG: hypothetical protein WC657_06530, partial [Candidatus Paceibacterota bacterium]